MASDPGAVFPACAPGCPALACELEFPPKLLFEFPPNEDDWANTPELFTPEPLTPPELPNVELLPPNVEPPPKLELPPKAEPLEPFAPCRGTDRVCAGDCSSTKAAAKRQPRIAEMQQLEILPGERIFVMFAQVTQVISVIEIFKSRRVASEFTGR